MTFREVDILFQVIVFLFAISVHESAHAWMAWRLGDPTARMLGRVTLNPIKHIDLVGTILLPLVAIVTHFPVIGWAKPTPVNTRHFKHLVRDDVLTSVAGPASNFLVAICAVVVLGIISLIIPGGRVQVYNAISYHFTRELLIDTNSTLAPIALLLYELMFINVLLGIFNLIPVPPLDGSHVIRHFLAEPILRIYDSVGYIGLLLLMFWGGNLLWTLMAPVVNLFNAVLLRI